MQLNRQPQSRKRAFTLIEVLIVIAILLAIGGLVVVNLIPQKEQSDVKLQRVQIQNIDNAMKLFKLNMKRWPTEEEGLPALWNKDVIQNEDEKALWSGPYLENPISKDTWKHDLIYRNPSERGEGLYDIVSVGPDGEEGTADDITNFDNAKNAEGETTSQGDNFAPPSAPSSGSSSSKGG